jgi:hypothetical protein
LWVLREVYGSVPSLADILSRAYEEVRQVGAASAKFGEQVEAIKKAILVGCCRTVDEIVEDTTLSRWVVDRALDKLVADRVVEPRDKYLLADEAEESGRRPTEYHPADFPRGEDFTYILDRSRDDDLL